MRLAADMQKENISESEGKTTELSKMKHMNKKKLSGKFNKTLSNLIYMQLESLKKYLRGRKKTWNK